MKLSPGFRFHPTDVELVLYYLKRKVMGKKLLFNGIAEVDIYKFAPWDLPDKSCMINGNLKWYFFCPAEKKYASGARLKRSTEFGYWKTTGRDRPVHYNNKVMGLIKTLIFHRGKAPKGDRTDWVMHEYRLEDCALADRGVIQNAYLLCIVFQKDGRGPQNGAQYGAPFKEEDWSDDEEEVNCVGAESYGGSSAPTLPQPINKASFISTRSRAPESMCTGSSCVSCPSHCGHSSYEMPCIGEDNFITTSSRGPEVMCNGSLHVPDPSNGVHSAYEMLPPVSGNTMDLVNSAQPMDDEILSLLAPFYEQDNLSLNENDKNKLQELNCCSGVGYLEAAPNCEGNDIHGNLSDSGNPNGQNACGCTNNSAASEAYEAWWSILPNDNQAYVDLMDLETPINFDAQSACGCNNFVACSEAWCTLPGSNEAYLELTDLGSTPSGAAESEQVNRGAEPGN